MAADARDGLVCTGGESDEADLVRGGSHLLDSPLPLLLLGPDPLPLRRMTVIVTAVLMVVVMEVAGIGGEGRIELALIPVHVL